MPIDRSWVHKKFAGQITRDSVVLETRVDPATGARVRVEIKVDDFVELFGNANIGNGSPSAVAKGLRDVNGAPVFRDPDTGRPVPPNTPGAVKDENIASLGWGRYIDEWEEEGRFKGDALPVSETSLVATDEE